MVPIATTIDNIVLKAVEKIAPHLPGARKSTMQQFEKKLYSTGYLLTGITAATLAITNPTSMLFLLPTYALLMNKAVNMVHNGSIINPAINIENKKSLRLAAVIVGSHQLYTGVDFMLQPSTEGMTPEALNNMRIIGGCFTINAISIYTNSIGIYLNESRRRFNKLELSIEHNKK